MIGSSVSAKICPFQSHLTAHLFISGAFPNSNHHLANKPSHINHPSPFKHNSHPSEKSHTPIFSSFAFNTSNPHNTRNDLPVHIFDPRRTRTVRSYFPSSRPKQTSKTRLQTRPSLCTRRIPRNSNVPLPRSRRNKFRSSPLPPPSLCCVFMLVAYGFASPASQFFYVAISQVSVPPQEQNCARLHFCQMAVLG